VYSLPAYDVHVNFDFHFRFHRACLVTWWGCGGAPGIAMPAPTTATKLEGYRLTTDDVRGASTSLSPPPSLPSPALAGTWNALVGSRCGSERPLSSRNLRPHGAWHGGETRPFGVSPMIALDHCTRTT
jgi:hypothetical protein